MTDKMYEQAFQLLQNSLWGNTGDFNGETLTEETVDFLDAQRLLAIPMDLYKTMRCENPECEKKVFYALGSLSHFHAIKNTTKEITELLEREGIRAVIIKGTAAAISYPNPDLRSMGDIDCFISGEGDETKLFEKAREILTGNGWEEVNHDNPRHMEFEKPVPGTESGKCFLEIHHYLMLTDSSEADKKINAYLRDEMGKSISYTCDNISFYGLPKIANGISLLCHIMRHMLSGLGFRQIIDFAEYVTVYLDDETWEKEFSEKAKEFHLQNLAKTTVAVAKKYLGMPPNTRDKKTITWDTGISDAAVDSFYELLLQSGNFGKGFSRGEHTGNAVGNEIRINGFGKTLMKRGLENWEAARKHKILRPLVPFFQGGIWIKKAWKGRKEGVTRGMQASANSLKLFEELEVPYYK